jgi:hypothetical protein
MQRRVLGLMETVLGQDLLHYMPTYLIQQRPRASPVDSAAKDTWGEEAAGGVSWNKINPIDHWREKRR